MSYLVQPRLVNEPFSDPGLIIDFRFGRRAILFDLGDLTPLSSREILRVGHVFVSHMHMDHFAGFDRLLRLNLYQPRRVALFGPEGLGDAVEAKLKAYTWNLLGPHSVDFSLSVTEWDGEGFSHCSLFRAREAFRRSAVERPSLSPGLLHDEPDFHVEAALLDHGIACLAFAFQERLRVNVHKARLDALDLPVGPWLTDAKRAIRRGNAEDTCILVSPHRPVSLGTLIAEGAFHIGRGQRIVYAVDMAYHAENLRRIGGLARGADHLFIEAGFLDEDRALAAEKKHLTAAQAGHIARMAAAKRVTPLHFSARYLDRERELRDELDTAFGSASMPRPPAENAGTFSRLGH